MLAKTIWGSADELPMSLSTSVVARCCSAIVFTSRLKARLRTRVLADPRADLERRRILLDQVKTILIQNTTMEGGVGLNFRTCFAANWPDEARGAYSRLYVGADQSSPFCLKFPSLPAMIVILHCLDYCDHKQAVCSSTTWKRRDGAMRTWRNRQIFGSVHALTNGCKLESPEQRMRRAKIQERATPRKIHTHFSNV